MFAKQIPGYRSHWRSHWSARRFVVSALVFAIALAGFVQGASAQRYQSIQPKITIKASKPLRSKANAALRGGPFSAESKQAIDDYYTKFYFLQMTQYDPSSLTLLGKLREELIKSLRTAKVPKAQEHLAQQTLKFASIMARSNFHPAVRYNATLILGQLDQRFPVSGSNPVAPIVLAEGTKDLLELLEQSEFKGVKVHPSVKVGALEGLERHLQFGMEAQFKEPVTKAALTVMAQEAKTLEVDEEVNNWMKCQAARVLARQFKDGPTQEVHAALTALIADEKMDIAHRCCVSGLLKLITYTSGSQADVKETLLPLGKLAKAVVAEGAEVSREFQDIILGNKRPARRSSGGRNGDQGPKLERRELLSRLVQIEQGATSLAAGLAEAEKQKLVNLTAMIEPVITQSKNSKAFDIDLIREVFKLEDSVDDLIASWQPAAAPAVEPAEFDDE